MMNLGNLVTDIGWSIFGMAALAVIALVYWLVILAVDLLL